MCIITRFCDWCKIKLLRLARASGALSKLDCVNLINVLTSDCPTIKNICSSFVILKSGHVDVPYLIHWFIDFSLVLNDWS